MIPEEGVAVVVIDDVRSRLVAHAEEPAVRILRLPRHHDGEDVLALVEHEP